MSIILAILAGTGLGYITERGGFCFHSTWRGLIGQPRRLELVRAYLLLMLISIPLVQGMIALGWINPWIPPFVPAANIIGGLIFGIGMVVGATCITGLFYKLGHGMLGMVVGLTAWALGDILTYKGPLATWRDSLNGSPIIANGESATIVNFLGIPGTILLVIFAIAAALYLWRTPRNAPLEGRDKLWGWLSLGIGMGLFTALVWLLAKVGGANYTFGTSRVPTGIYEALIGQGGGGSLWIPLTLISVIPGAFIAAKISGTLWVRGETTRRYVELAAGGLLMGVGAGIAGGCNLGHSTVGVPLLSVGSITTTLSMIVGVFLADRVASSWGLVASKKRVPSLPTTHHSQRRL